MAPADTAWQDAFKAGACRIGFSIQLSRPQLEFLCAVADGVHWDRAAFGQMQSAEHMDGTARALIKRGLICQRNRDERDRDFRQQAVLLNFYGASNWSLTPAGEHIVALVKLAGIFREADAAIAKRRPGFSRN